MNNFFSRFIMSCCVFALSHFGVGGLSAQEVDKPALAPAVIPVEVAPLALPGAEAHMFRATPQGELRLHVYKPEGWRADDRRAAFVWFFGGGWTKGTPGPGWAKVSAAWGMVGIAPDYRTKNRHDTAPQMSVADARAAVRWVQAHAAELGIDPANVVVGGNSAGGPLALWTAIGEAPPGSDAKDSPLAPPAALMLTCPVSDTSKATLGSRAARFGGDADALSPLHRLDAKMPPLLVFHGDADTLVPQQQSIALREKYLATGNVCELVSVPGGSHSFERDLPEWRGKMRAAVREFLAKMKVLPGR